MTTALAERTDAAPPVTSDQLDLIRRTIAKDATPDELKLYLYDCARQGVHPLDKLIHFTKRSGKYTPVTSIDFMRTRAADTGEYAGSEDAQFITPLTENGAPDHAAAPIQATVTVWRLVQGQQCRFTATARWSEYKPDANDFMWKKMPHTMLAKCAEALALRKGFPRQLAGLYAKEEMDQAGNGGLVVEAPAAAVASIPAATISREDSARTPSAGNGGDSRHLPPGAVFITKVKPGFGETQAYLITSAMQPGDDRGFAVYKEQLKTLAEEVCQNQEAVTLEFKTSKAGKDYVVGIKRVPFTVDVAPESEWSEVEPPPLSDKDIPF